MTAEVLSDLGHCGAVSGRDPAEPVVELLDHRTASGQDDNPSRTASPVPSLGS
jgi:hypothetical protein